MRVRRAISTTYCNKRSTTRTDDPYLATWTSEVSACGGARSANYRRAIGS